MTVADMKVNLAILLGEYHNTDLKEEELCFPDESDMMNILNSDQIVIPASESEMVVGEPCAVIWDLPSGRDWYLGFVTSVIDNDTYIVDHLERSTRDESKMYWRYPRR